MRNFVIISATLLLAACKSSAYLDKQEYTLNTEGSTEHYNTLQTSLGITNTVTRPLYQNNEFLYRVKGNKLEHDFYNLFATPPAQIITNNTTKWFERTGLFDHVFTTDLALASDYTLKSKLVTLEADYTNPRTPTARMEIEYILLTRHNDILIDKHYSSNQRLSEKSTTALINAWNKGITQILSYVTHDIAAALSATQHIEVVENTVPMGKPVKSSDSMDRAKRFMSLDDNTEELSTQHYHEPSAEDLLRLE